MPASRDTELSPPGGWRKTSHIRLPPLQWHELHAPTRLLIRLINRIGNLEASNLFMMLARDFRLFWHWLMFARTLMPHGTLDRRDTEIAILRVGWNCRCRYEWGQHVDIGLRHGLTIEDVLRIPEGPRAAGWEPRHIALLQACDDFHQQRMIGESTWKVLSTHYMPKQLLEVVMLIGHYEMLAGVLNSTGLPLDSAQEDVLRRLHLPLA